jgi:SAM-dependent methyltransferase
MSMNDVWEANAEDWIRWARTPEVDHYFWRFCLPSLLRLLPPPRRQTVEVGSGEGRVCRELRALGHRVVGVEPSPTLARASRVADPTIEVIEAPMTAIPMPDDHADLVVSSMALMNVEDLPAAVREMGRILQPGGALVFSMLHPFNSWSDLGPDASYFAERAYTTALSRGGLAMTFHDIHRSFDAISRALEYGGFAIELLREPVPTDEHVAAYPDLARWRTQPCFLLGRARRRDA